MLTIPEQNLFGLDISQSKLRLVQIRTKHRRKMITALRELRLPNGIIVDGEIADPKQLSQMVATIYRGKELRDRIAGNGVISVLPESKTFMKLITLPTSEAAQVETLLRDEIPRHIPLPLEEIYYDWQPLPNGADGKTHVLLGVAPKHLVDGYLAVLRAAGLLPFALEIEAAPIARCLLKDAAADDQTVTVIIDMGAARTGLMVARSGVIQFTVSLPVSGDRITHTISETLKISGQEAEEAKIVCGLDSERCQGALKKVLYATFDDLVKKIESSLDFYRDNFADAKPVGDILLTGGGANFLNVDQILAERLQLPVHIGNPLTNVQLAKASVPATTLQSYATAIGLALRSTHREAVI
ncbi:MAG: type IV pilus assembly protein PilM [Parcubacteria group bacterium Gr01-1014_31]|nr:MAG: type IV pilus assembly protein PilM [Parcubacteria group bacterium Gr01-1014_31]